MKILLLAQYCSCLFLSIFFFYGIHSYVNKLDENKCEMTYMFEYPQYIKIGLSEITSNSFPEYGLYVYGEGEQADSYRKGFYEGLPVLFIPGNSGSHKQVRSLASIAYRKALDSRKGVKLDFFTLDFNEELSALYGGVLYEQANFTREAIKKVISLYKGRKNEVPVVMIGHSMGGIVAKAAVDELTSVPTIITLATPHEHPVVVFDKIMADVYESIQKSWSNAKLNKRITIASIGGADRDIQVRSGLTMDSNTSVNVLTTEIPGAWVTADHLCIVWCKQVVTVVVRSLFDLIDPYTGNWIENFEKRQEVLSYHLKKRYSGKSIRSVQNTRSVSFDPDGRWREMIASHFVGVIDKGEPANTYFMIPLVDNAHRDRLTAIGSGLPANWVFGCVATSWRKSVRFCERGDNLSDQTVFLPYTEEAPKKKQVYLDLIQLRLSGYTHVVFNIPKAHPAGLIIFDIHRSTDRNRVTSELMSGSGDLRITAEMLSHNITLPSFSQTWQSVSFFVKKISNCQSSQRKALIRKVVPWSHENQFYWTNDTGEVHLHKPKSALSVDNYEPAHIQIINPNQCNFEISIKYSWRGISTQLARFYLPFILPSIAAIYLFCLSHQLRTKEIEAPIPSVTRCILNIPILKTVMWIEGIAFLIRHLEAKISVTWLIPKSDVTQLNGESLNFPFMFLVLGAVAWVSALFIAVIFLVVITAGGHILQSSLIRYLRSYLGISSVLAELLAMGVSRLPVVISVVLVAFGASTCGSFALFIGLFICIWKLFSYFEDELESMISEEEQQSNDGDFRVNTTLSLLWLCTAILSLPTFVVWIRSPRLTLVHDPFLIPSFIWSFCGMIVLHRSKIGRPGQMYTYKRLGYIIFILATLSLFYGIQSLYRIQYFTTAAVAAYALKQLS